MRFTESVVIVTGGTGALGRYVTKAFLEEGARVATTYVVDAEVPETKELLGPLAEDMRPYRVDVTSEEEVTAFVSRALEDFGKVDVLVNVVGGYMGGPTVTETSLKDWRFMMDLNLTSAFLVSRAVVPHLVKRGGGKIVSVASISGLKGEEGHAAYSASKAGVIRLTEALSEEVRGKGVNVNCIMPTIIDTPANRKAMPKANFDKWPKPWEVARVILLLASEDARLLHGAAIPV